MLLRLLLLPCLLGYLWQAATIEAALDAEAAEAELKGNFTNDQYQLLASTGEQLSDEELGFIIKSFGQQMSSSIAREMDKLLDEVQQTADSQELARFKRANEALTKDTQVRIELAGEKNTGEHTRGWASSLGQSFLGKANSQLQSAGAYLGHQMTMLSGLAPKVRGQLRAIPGKLMRLMQWPTFFAYKSLYKKTYKSAREELYRQINYLNSQAACGVQNIKFVLGKTTHLLRATQFADLSAAEYQATYNNRMAETKADEPASSGKLTVAKLSQLEKLARENRTVFGKLPQVAKSLDRKRRSLDTYNELDESESDDEGSQTERDDDDEEEEDFVDAVDEYASEFFEGANTDSLAELEHIADQALEEHHVSAEFKPIDLRQTGCLIKPEDQLECGCCYAHVVAAAASYYNCMQQQKQQQQQAPVTTRPVRYNARFISDCGRYADLPTVGCRGGRLSRAVRFTQIAGTQTYQTYELARLSQDNFDSDYCAYPKPPTLERWSPERVPFFEESEFHTMSDLNEADLHLRTIGPVWLNVRTWKDFHLQGPGIHDKYDESEVAMVHSMLLVGHDRDTRGRDYWILWNSHGTEWGEQGYLRIYNDPLEYFAGFTAGLMPTKFDV